MPVYEGAEALQKDIEELQPPPWVAAKLQGALHVIPPTTGLRIPSASPAPARAGSAGSAVPAAQIAAVSVEAGFQTVVDPWFFEGAFNCTSGSGKVPEWLKGAVRRRP